MIGLFIVNLSIIMEILLPRKVFWRFWLVYNTQSGCIAFRLWSLTEAVVARDTRHNFTTILKANVSRCIIFLPIVSNGAGSSSVEYLSILSLVRTIDSNVDGNSSFKTPSGFSLRILVINWKLTLRISST